ncbi:MAG: TauD/TfdA family dioxygenase, partial [Pseudomonadota bacterium]
MTELPNQAMDHPAAWRGEDLAVVPDRWTYDLSMEQIAEIESAAVSKLARDGEPRVDRANDFPLPETGPALADWRLQLTDGLGFVLVRGLPVERWDIRTVATVFCGLGAHLGRARSQNARGHILGHVTDVGADLSDPTVRIYQTQRRQTFHTDSVDVVGLLCIREAMEGGDSLLVSTLTLSNEMRHRYPDLWPLLFRRVATDRRGEVPQGMDPWFEIPVLSWHEGFLTGLYQRQYIDSAARLVALGAPALSEGHRAALDAWDALTNDPALHLTMRLRPGDMQFVYNHHMLHDR